MNTELSNGQASNGATSNGSRASTVECVHERAKKSQSTTEFDKTKSNARVAQLFKDP